MTLTPKQFKNKIEPLCRRAGLPTPDKIIIRPRGEYSDGQRIEPGRILVWVTNGMTEVEVRDDMTLGDFVGAWQLSMRYVVESMGAELVMHRLMGVGSE